MSVKTKNRLEQKTRVSIRIEPDSNLTREWLKRMIADARRWKAETHKEAA